MGLIVLPKTLVAHTDAVAADVMADFNAILAQVNGALDSENLSATLRAALFEAGDIKATARAAAPSGWLMCEGQAVSRATYSALFSGLGTTYGAGDGVTTFNVPDLRGRVPVGVDGAAGRLSKSDARGNSGGHEKLAQHIHGSGTMTTTTEGSTHTHGLGWSAAFNNLGGPSVAKIIVEGGFTKTTEEESFHAHTVIGSTSVSGEGTGENMPPYQVFNWLVKT